MGVAEEKKLGYREENDLPRSDNFEENTKRERAETVSVVEPQGKRVKT